MNTISEEMNGFRREVQITPPYDKRHKNPSKNYGIGGMMLRMMVVKNKSAIQFVAYLPVYLPHVVNELSENGHNFKGAGFDVGYHSPTPQYAEQKPIEDNCPATGGVCYYDGSSLQAEPVYEVFLQDGMDAVWPILESRWREMF
jgi:hypothetical protein